MYEIGEVVYWMINKNKVKGVVLNDNGDNLDVVIHSINDLPYVMQTNINKEILI